VLALAEAEKPQSGRVYLYCPWVVSLLSPEDWFLWALQLIADDLALPLEQGEARALFVEKLA